MSHRTGNAPVKTISWRKTVLFCGLVWILTLGTAEAGLRLFWIRPPSVISFSFHNPAYQLDGQLGWRPKPNFTWVQSIYPGHLAAMTTNSKGFRDREHSRSRQPGVSRVVVLGDSFAYGLGVNDGETFCDYLGSLAPELEVINLGVAGWNLSQERRLLELEGLNYSPDLVVVSFVQNDVTAKGIPDMASLAKREEKVTWKAWLADRSYVYALAKTAARSNRSLNQYLIQVGIRRDPGGYEALDDNLRPALRTYPQTLMEDWNAAVNELLTIQRLCEKSGAKLLVASVPARQALSPETFAATIAEVALYQPEDFDLPKPYRQLGEFCEEHGIPYVNGYEGLRRLGSDIYIPYDMHFNAKGHRAFAEILVEPIRQILLQKEREAAPAHTSGATLNPRAIARGGKG
jgi:lysophospholipase L1-like esterase